MTDHHLGLKKGSTHWHDLAKRSFDDACQYAKDNQITRMAYLGDFFHDRKLITIPTIPVALSIGKSISEAFKEVYMIEGNHDQYFKDQPKPSSLDILEEKYHNIHILYEPLELENMLLVPWVFDKTILEGSKKRFCLGHFEIGGFVQGMNGKLNIGDFKSFELVLSGHFHTRMRKDNIQYLGGPYHMTFNDIGDRGFHIFDSETGVLEFIPFANYPKFFSTQDDNVFTKEDICGNTVRIIFTKELGSKVIGGIVDKIKEYQPLQLFVNFEIDRGFTEDSLSDVEMPSADLYRSSKDIHIEYLSKAELPPNLKLKMLSTITNKLWEEIL